MALAPIETAQLDQVVQRVRAEFLEMPGLRLTAAQARRLWRLDEFACAEVLERLVAARFLRPACRGGYVRND